MNIAAVICTCRNEIGSHIDLQNIKQFCEKQPDVKKAELYEASCSINNQDELVEIIKNNGIDSLLFIGCSPQYYEEQFQDIFYERIKINPGLIKFVNIREQLIWSHRDQEEAKLIEKAQIMIKAGLEELRYAKQIKIEKIPNIKSVLVLGGGISGIHATLTLANQGYKVFLVEKKPFLGGKQMHFGRAFPRDECSSCAITTIINSLMRTKNVEIFTLSEMVKARGHTGNYIITIRKNPRYVTGNCSNCHECFAVCKNLVPDEFNFNLVKRKTIHLPNFGAYPMIPFISNTDIDYCREKCTKLCVKVCDSKAIDIDQQPEEIELNVGGIINAIGYDMYQPTEYGYGKSKDVLTLEEYERILVANGIYKGKILRPSDEKPPKNIAFVLCVGSRTQNKVPYCSRYCCMAASTAIKQTVESLPNTKIYVFYRDVYAIGKMGEEYIKEVQDLGNVEWVRAIPDLTYENIDGDGNLTLSIKVSGGKVVIPFDMIVLATPMIPNKDTEQIRELLGLSKTPEGYFKESDMMLGPVSTHDDGKYLAGACIGPKTINEAVVDGYAAAASVSRVLVGDEIPQFFTISDVDATICGGEGICVKTCYFHACSIDEEKKISVVDPTLCRGCGNCVAACPTGARDLLLSPTESIYKYIDTISEYKPPNGPKVLGILCDGCAYPAADTVGLSGKYYPINLSIMRVPCSGRIDPRFILYAFEKGFDGILLGRCHEENCQYIAGNYDFAKRVDLLKELLKSRSIDENQVKILTISYLEGDKFIQEVKDFVEVLNGGK